MVEELKKSLAALGDTGSREHQFYAPVLNDSYRKALDQATELSGLNGEIALMRVEIRSLIEADPANIKAIQSAILAVERLVRTRHYIGNSEKEGLSERMNKLLKSLSLPLSIVGSGLKK